jgi:hypothetical protein
MTVYGYIRGHRWEQTEFGKCLTTIGIGVTEELKCTRCQKPPTREGHDQCLGRLPGVTAACCGHGVEPGYIQFRNGLIIRGFFEVEKKEGEGF